jgi:hypothetical protein
MMEAVVIIVGLIVVATLLDCARRLGSWWFGRKP